MCSFRKYINIRNPLPECAPQLSQPIKCILDHIPITKCTWQTSTTSNATLVPLPFCVPPLICQKVNKKCFALLNYEVFKVCTSLITFHKVMRSRKFSSLKSSVTWRILLHVQRSFCCPTHFTAWRNADTALWRNVREQIGGYLNHCHQSSTQSCRLHCTLEKKAKAVSTSYLKCQGNSVPATFPH